MNAMPGFIGQRIVVTGLAGSGKSTFSGALAEQTGLPLIHLDLAFWQPGWVAPSEDEWRHIQRTALAGDAWIADGNYSDSPALRRKPRRGSRSAIKAPGGRVPRARFHWVRSTR
ncbi:MAG: hypothetical protein R8F63_16430 [Acidimicrobiales bacterium]|nr:hypothetical protein [Acidimicrobiales bacterium]